MSKAWRGVVLSTLVALFLGATPAMAHTGAEGAGIQVEPSTVTAGNTVTLAGSGLEPNSERVLALAGEDMIVNMGSVTTDADGMFQIELTIPAHLPSGTYELQAIGDETLTTPLAVNAAAGIGSSPAPDAANDTVVARDRTPIELGLIAAFVVVAAGAGAWFVWRAERFRGEARG